MCEFISAIKSGEDYFYLTKDDLKGKKFNEYKKYNSLWKDDIYGHGAIEFFYPDIKGEHWECEDFSSPDNFPECIVKDIKEGMFEGLGICLDVLNKEGKEEFEKIKDSAYAKYEKITNSVYAKYLKIRKPACAKYWKIKDSAWDEYKKIERPALAEFEKIEDCLLYTSPSPRD